MFLFCGCFQVGPGRGVAARGPLGRGPMQGRAGPPAAGPRGFSGPAPARLRNAKGNLPSMLNIPDLFISNFDFYSCLRGYIFYYTNYSNRYSVPSGFEKLCS